MPRPEMGHDGAMEQLHEFRAMNEQLGEFTDRLNPEFLSAYPLDASLDPASAYGRRTLDVFDLVDVTGRVLITAGRPAPGFELLYAAHAEMSAVVSISSSFPGVARTEAFWVSRHGVTQSRFATPPASDDGVLWLQPFESLAPAVLEIASLANSTDVPAEFRVPVKRSAVRPLVPRVEVFAAIADAIRGVSPGMAEQLDAGNGRQLSLSVDLVDEGGLQSIDHTWVVTPVGALTVVFEKERMFRPDTFITSLSLFELRRRIEDLLPGEAQRRFWTRLAAETAEARVDTTIPG